MSLKEANAERWQKMHVARSAAAKSVADRINLNKPRYQAVAARTGVPWEFIAVTHYREANLDFNTYLGNGEPLNRKTRLVPKGRGPFASWEDGAVDALVNAPPKAASNTDWSIGGTLEKLEEYNGLGYYKRGQPSPYLWAGTDQYVKGKYVADGVYDPNHIDTQLGVAAVLKALNWKSTPVSTGGTIGGAVVAGGGMAVAWNFATVKLFVENHWMGILAGAIAAGILVDVIITYIRKKKENGNA